MDNSLDLTKEKEITLLPLYFQDRVTCSGSGSSKACSSQQRSSVIGGYQYLHGSGSSSSRLPTFPPFIPLSHGHIYTPWV